MKSVEEQQEFGWASTRRKSFVTGSGRAGSRGMRSILRAFISMSSAACPTCGGSVDPATGVCPQCATQINPRSGAPVTATESYAVTPGTDKPETPEISGYRVINRLGEGGMGAV